VAEHKPTVADILATAENPAYHRVATARILLRQDLEERYDELAAKLDAALAVDKIEDSLVTTAGPIAAEIRALEAEKEAAKVPFRMRSIGRKPWQDLARDYPPTNEQLAAERKRAQHVGERPMDMEHNPETFPIAAISASLIEPEMKYDEVERLSNSITLSQWLLLWNKCVEANAGGITDQRSPLAARLASGPTLQPSDDIERPPTTTAFPAPSSSDG
jgi:hypothetical protein